MRAKKTGDQHRGKQRANYASGDYNVLLQSAVANKVLHKSLHITKK